MTMTLDWQLWHSNQNSLLRNVNESAKWMKEQLNGVFYKTIGDAMGHTAIQADLEYIGFRLDFSEERDGQTSPEHPEVAGENELACSMGRLGLALVGHRLRRMAWMLRGWPANASRMLGNTLRSAPSLTC